MRVLSKSARHEAIRRALRNKIIGTQQDLQEVLRREGIDVTQATLSRDLQELGVLRVSRPEGAVYELDPIQAQAAPDVLELGETILSMGENSALVVLRTRPGMASAVALAIDNARLASCLGTLAGDDTIFATPARGETTHRLAMQIQRLFGRMIT